MWFRPTNRKASKRRFRPQLDHLEARCVPAVVVSLAADIDGNEIVRIVSNNASDTIEIEDNGATIDVAVNGAAPTTFGTDVVIVEVLLNGGNDSLFIDMNDLDGLDRTYLIRTGSGNDLVDIFHDDVTEGGSNIYYEVLDRAGKDSFNFVSSQEITGTSVVRFNVVQGSRLDSASFTFDGTGANCISGSSAVHIEVDQGTGNDRFSLLIAEDITLGALDVGLRSQAGNDIASVDFFDDVEDHGNVNIVALLGAGNDIFTATFDTDSFDINEGGGVNGAAVNISVFGESGNDSLQATKTTDSDDETIINATVLDIHFNGGNGRDRIVVDLFTKVEGDGVFLGIGAIVILADGGSGNDDIIIRLSNDEDSDNTFDVTALGGSGNDFISFRGFNDGSDDLVFLGDAIILDGGFGRDTKSVDGNYPVFDANFEFIA